MHQMLHYIDVTGTFVFALSGAVAGVRKEFDIFGIFVLAMVTAIGGGVIRDICIAATPPAGLISSEYFLAVVMATLAVFFFQNIILTLNKPVLFFDALGLGFFAAFGANKVFHLTQNVQLAVLLGCVSAVGGGCLRDVLTGDSPVIFRKEIYASAALTGAGVELLGSTGIIAPELSIWFAILTCVLIRLLSLRYNIRLPSARFWRNADG